MDEIERTKLFVHLAEQKLPQFTTMASVEQRLQVISCYEQLRHMADRLNIPFNVEQQQTELPQITEALGQESVELDSAWRQKIHSYISHIRAIVAQDKDLRPDIREKILDRLADFAKTVEWQRTPVDNLMRRSVRYALV
jgi:hypothetical protein